MRALYLILLVSISAQAEGLIPVPKVCPTSAELVAIEKRVAKNERGIRQLNNRVSQYNSGYEKLSDDKLEEMGYMLGRIEIMERELNEIRNQIPAQAEPKPRRKRLIGKP